MDGVLCDRRCLLLSNHALVLRVIAADPRVRVREIAERVEISERAVESLISELIDVGFLSRRRSGRRNVYEVFTGAKLRHPLISEHTVGDLVEAIAPPEGGPEAAELDAPAPVIAVTPDEILASLGATGASLMTAETQSTKDGGTVKVLVYMVVASVLLCASVAVAATRVGHHAKPVPPPHEVTQPAAARKATATHAFAGGAAVTFTLVRQTNQAKHAASAKGTDAATAKESAPTTATTTTGGGTTSGGAQTTAPPVTTVKLPPVTVTTPPLTVTTPGGGLDVNVGGGLVHVHVDPPPVPPLPLLPPL
jgi:DNA-binding Lrp family transcriptional regulator